MKIKFLNNKNKVILSIITGFLILIGIVFGITNYLMGKILIKKQELGRQQLSLEYLIKEGTKIGKYQELSEKMNSNQAAIQEAIILEEEQLKLIESLESVANSLGVYIKKSPYSPPKKRQNIVQETTANADNNQAQEQEEKNLNYLMVSYVGSYENLLKFIYKIENFEYAVKLKSLNISILEKLDRRRIKEEQAEFQENLSETGVKAEILLSFKVL